MIRAMIDTTRPVDPGRLLDLVRHLPERVGEEPDGERHGEAELGDADAHQGVQQADVGEEQAHRQQHHDAGEERERQHRGKQLPAARHRQPPQGVRRGAGEQQADHRRAQREQQTAPQRRVEAEHRVGQRPVVDAGQRARQQAAAGADRVRVEAEHHHDPHREHREGDHEQAAGPREQLEQPGRHASAHDATSSGTRVPGGSPTLADTLASRPAPGPAPGRHRCAVPVARGSSAAGTARCRAGGQSRIGWGTTSTGHALDRIAVRAVVPSRGSGQPCLPWSPCRPMTRTSLASENSWSATIGRS